MQNVDLIIQDGILCTMNPQREIKNSTSVVINNGKILAILDSELAQKQYTAKRVLNGKDCIVMPGLINTHTHSALSFLRGISDDLSLMDWLTRYIWPLEQNFIDEEFVFHATRLAIHEMILSGTTTFSDSYFFSREVAKAAKTMGMRCIAGELVFDSSPIGKSPQDVFSYSEESIQEWKNDSLVNISLSPHSLYACSPEIIKMSHGFATKNDLLLNILVSESKKEVSDIESQFGKTPIGLLNHLGILNPNLIATHCVHLKESDIDLLVKSETKISHNPESNMKLGNGVSPVSQLIQSGAVVGIGTDGAASNNDLSLFSEIAFASKLQKGFFHDATLFNSLQAVEMLTIHGAKTLRLDQKTGSIEVGKQADIILIDLNAPNLTPLYDPYSHIVHATHGSNVQSVIIDGKLVAHNRTIIGHDFQEIRETANRYSAEIKAYLKI